MRKLYTLLPSLLIISPFAAAQNAVELETVTITGGQESIATLPGSATWIDTEAMETYEHSDIQKVLEEAPGVYTRGEDGYGLRPNIGMRGAAAERSQKINIMEDGILIGPAPYSAPPAYYFPNVSRINAVEVFKGPVSIQYGPHTIGGALNLLTQPVPTEFSGEINAGIGSDSFRRLHAHVGSTNETVGFLVEGLTIATDGFKELSNGDSTGFERNDINLKTQVTSDPAADYVQRFTVKFGYGNEHSNETYLGLTDFDFETAPYQRYAASALDQMTWDHRKLHADYEIDLSETSRLTTRLYRNEFERAWRRLDDFADSIYSISNILSEADPDDPTKLAQNRLYDLLTGELNSNGNPQQQLDIITNDREYYSQGIEFIFENLLETEAADHQLTMGLRYHEDEVDRFHTTQTYDMINAELIHDGEAREIAVNNKGHSKAWSGFVKDEITIGQWQHTLGLRVESIDTEFTNELDPSEDNDQSNTILIPGAGVFYQVNERLGVLAGVNRGFSHNAPSSSAANVDPETSVNWEAGFRYQTDSSYLESILFFNDYRNLIGRCRASDDGCDGGEEFNGGEVEIAGLELVARHNHQLETATIPLQLTYTYTETAFQSGFNSEFSQWGDVSQGDELPYIPDHAVNLKVGYERGPWLFSVAANYLSEMRESAGSGTVPDSEKIPDQFTLDLATNYQFTDKLKMQFKIDNVSDEANLVSRRPFGARPNKPRTVELGMQYLFN